MPNCSIDDTSKIACKTHNNQKFHYPFFPPPFPHFSQQPNQDKKNPSKTYKIIPLRKQNKPKKQKLQETFPLNYKNDHRLNSEKKNITGREVDDGEEITESSL